MKRLFAGVAAVGEKRRLAVRTSGARVEDIVFLEAQLTEKPDVGGPEVEEGFPGAAGGRGE